MRSAISRVEAGRGGLQTLVLLTAGEAGRALLNVALSVVICLIAVGLGYSLPSALTAMTRSVGT